MKNFNKHERSFHIGAHFIGAAPIDRTGVGGIGIGDREFWGRGPINWRWARSIGPYTMTDFGRYNS